MTTQLLVILLRWRHGASGTRARAGHSSSDSEAAATRRAGPGQPWLGAWPSRVSALRLGPGQTEEHTAAALSHFGSTQYRHGATVPR